MIYSFKNRIYASFFLSERIYAILATQIYSLTFCQETKERISTFSTSPTLQVPPHQPAVWYCRHRLLVYSSKIVQEQGCSF